MGRYEVRKSRRQEISTILQYCTCPTELTNRALGMPKHLVGTFLMDLETYVTTSPEDITHGGDVNFFLDNGWYRFFDMKKIYDLFRKESMI